MKKAFDSIMENVIGLVCLAMWVFVIGAVTLIMLRIAGAILVVIGKGLFSIGNIFH